MSEAPSLEAMQLADVTQVHTDSALNAAVPSAMFERIVGDRVNESTLRWLVAGFRKYDELEGKLSLERCLRLPTSAQRRLAERNFWLRTVGHLVNESRPVARAQDVACRLSVFVVRGQWREWRAMSAPPSQASDLQHALFYAARAIGAGPIPKWRQILRVLDPCHRNPGC